MAVPTCKAKVARVGANLTLKVVTHVIQRQVEEHGVAKVGLCLKDHDCGQGILASILTALDGTMGQTPGFADKGVPDVGTTKTLPTAPSGSSALPGMAAVDPKVGLLPPSLPTEGTKLDKATGFDVATAAGAILHEMPIPKFLEERYRLGNDFDRMRRLAYPFNEIVVGPVITADGPKLFRLDSYVPNKLIVSRKASQLAEVFETTARSYVREIVTKYKPGTPIYPSDRNKAYGFEGAFLRGQMVLEIPPQIKDIPRGVIDYADTQGVVIIDSEGRIYR